MSDWGMATNLLQTDKRYPTGSVKVTNASILKNNRVVFNICGNKYRIVVLTDYVRHGILIRFVGTHKQYDEIKDIDNI